MVTLGWVGQETEVVWDTFFVVCDTRVGQEFFGKKVVCDTFFIVCGHLGG
jgi:hypothetical protein